MKVRTHSGAEIACYSGVHNKPLTRKRCPSSKEQHRHDVWQYSTAASLMAGAYDGKLTARQLRRHGNLGVGTFNALNGEMIVVDGEVWHVPADGKPIRADLSNKVPFTVLVPFEPRLTSKIPAGLDLTGLSALLDSRVDDPGIIQAVRIDGCFSKLKLRSVKAQTPPYRPLNEVLAHDQVFFDLSDATGTIVGFRFPQTLTGVGFPGWHFHFIARDRKAGGHVVELTTGAALAALEPASNVDIELIRKR